MFMMFIGTNMCRNRLINIIRNQLFVSKSKRIGTKFSRIVSDG